jgi:repressor LexA
MGKTPPGETREKIFAFVRDRILGGFPPTVREVQEAFRFKAVQTAREHLEALIAEGRIQKKGKIARGFRLPSFGIRPGIRPPLFVPILGRVEAGALTTAVEEIEGYVPLEAGAFGATGGAESAGTSTVAGATTTHFALRVRGESMKDAGILPGDIVIVRRQPSAEDGEIVVALVEDEATVKRLRIRPAETSPSNGGTPGRRRKRVELHPENPAFAPITPDPENVRILGKVIEIRRKLEGV